jgi:hypothetical protein
MKFYTKQHKYYCGVDLHPRSLYMNIIDQKGSIVKHKNIDATPEAFPRVAVSGVASFSGVVSCLLVGSHL